MKEQNKDLFILFVDLTKAFDTVSRQGLWNILPRIGIPPKMVGMIRCFHDGMNARLANCDKDDEFPVTNGVKQGCVLAPTLFSFLFSMMLLSAFKETDPGVDITYRTDGDLFNAHRLKSRTKVTKAIVRELLYADDCAIVAHSEADLQKLTDSLSHATKRFGLTISIKKTEVLYQPAKGTSGPTPNILIDGKTLNNVETFTYLGSNISSANNLDTEISNRLAKANACFGRLRKRVWNERGLRSDTKCAVYRAVVLTTLLYGCESWTLYRRHVRLLEQFHQRCLRNIMGVKWHHRISNDEVLGRAKALSIDAIVTKTQLRWAGHLVRMSDDRLPKQIFYSELTGGARFRGRPKLRYKDTLKQSLKRCKVDISNWETSTKHRGGWRYAIHKGVEHLESSRKDKSEAKRKAAKARSITACHQVKCPNCGKLCASQFGLRSHMRIHLK